jgi:hypothetical protein
VRNEYTVTGFPYHETVGDKFVISTLTQRQGFKVYSDGEIQGTAEIMGALLE